MILLEIMARGIWFDSDKMHTISKGVGIHWEDLCEDISVAALLKG